MTLEEQKKLVAEFQQKFDASTDPELWVKLIEEEVSEVEDALAALLKEMADLEYVGAGLSNLYSCEDLSPELQARVQKAVDRVTHAEEVCSRIWDARSAVRAEGFKRVHASNMSKLDPETGQPIRREDGKIMKGPAYQPPVLIDLIRKE